MLEGQRESIKTERSENSVVANSTVDDQWTSSMRSTDENKGQRTKMSGKRT